MQFASRKVKTVQSHTLKTRIHTDDSFIYAENMAERNHQVQQMGEIYSSAKRVISWVGNEIYLTDILAYLNYCVRWRWKLLGSRWNSLLAANVPAFIEDLIDTGAEPGLRKK